MVSFEYNNHRFYAIDTPGLDDSEDVGPKNLFNKMITEFPKINKIIIVKKYNDSRLPENIQQLLISIMSSFPLKDFWDHVMIVNSWANPDDESFQDYMEEKRVTFCDKILKCEKLLKVMREKCIKIPTRLKEYFISSKNVKNNRKIQETFNEIKRDIQSNGKMFKNIIFSHIKERTTKVNENSYIITKYKTITCVGFDERRTESEQILEEREVSLKDCKIAYTKEESEFIEDDEVKFYDVLSFGIARAIRNTKKYRLYKVNYYIVGDQIIKGDKIFDRVEYR